MKFIDFLKQRESKFIELIDEQTWKEEKVYFVDEIVEMVNDYLFMVSQTSPNPERPCIKPEINCTLRYPNGGCPIHVGTCIYLPLH